MKRYVMRRSLGGAPDVTVHVPDGSMATLPHLVYHSPDGFEWGYGGSGPSDLARSIVGDVMDWKDPHPALYQMVKWKLIANMPHKGGEITEEQVREVLQGAGTT